jgi:hypothetical protein
VLADTVVTAGTYPTVRVTLANRSGRELLLVPSLDGSWWRLRYPHTYFEIIDEKGDTVTPADGFCGTTSPLRVGDFRPIPHNGDLTLFERSGMLSLYDSLEHPGRYIIRFVYSTNTSDYDAWGSFAPETEGGGTREKYVSLIARVPKVTVRSEPITLIVRP